MRGLDPAVIGGIVKTVTQAQNRHLEERLQYSIEHQIPTEIERRFAIDPRVGAVMHGPALEIAIALEAIQKKRRGLVRKIGNFFRNISERDGITVLKCPRTGTDLFHIDLFAKYRNTIIQMVNAHNDRVNGQGVFPQII